MTPKQRQFLELLKARMSGGPEKPIADFVMKLSAQELQDCLEAAPLEECLLAYLEQLTKQFASYFRETLSDKSKSQQGMLPLNHFIK